jgi:hypothetical protein
MQLQKERGSVRTATVSVPPLEGVAVGCVAGDGADRSQAPNPNAITATSATFGARDSRSCLSKNRLGGQKAGRQILCAGEPAN